jgi:hypothetical protein
VDKERRQLRTGVLSCLLAGEEETMREVLMRVRLTCDNCRAQVMIDAAINLEKGQWTPCDFSIPNGWRVTLEGKGIFWFPEQHLCPTCNALRIAIDDGDQVAVMAFSDRHKEADDGTSSDPA